MGRAATVWFVLTAVAAVVALALQIPISAADTDGAFDTPAARVANLFTLFTVLTTLVVAASCLQCALRPGLVSTFWRTLRVDAVLGIVIVAVVYHTLLAGLDDPQGTEVVVNLLWHTAVPIATVLGWLAFGPRGRVDVRVVAWSALYPLAWLAFTLARGAVIGWYPYPFVDVAELGYAQVALNCLGITALFLSLATALMAVDRILPGAAPRALTRSGA
ncbi:Pr6Pr family membrane protein [Pseudonocardia sp.]|uniref:Pr6Pr family membrane protein n=1 Tax=Pseudonocardia sp. TaxID=60912 RepID=UPI00260AB415|nr:Pr6Pr family membrane protein [Pseudonocardia sp.]